MKAQRPGAFLPAPLWCAASSDLELLARILHLFDAAENLGTELAVRLPDHLHRVFVVDNVPRGRIDAHLAARTGCRIGLDRVDEGLGIELAVELLDRLEHGVDRVPGIS